MNAFFRTRTPEVFWAVSVAVALFVTLGWLQRETMDQLLGATQLWIVRNSAWFLILTVNILLGFCLFLMAGRFGRLRLGKEDERPEFGVVSWLAMLFSAGMGIGLVFWAVAEPIMHFQKPPMGEGRTPEAAGRAMVITFYHWGLHAWGIYCITGLALGYFSFRHGFPLTIRSAFAPLLGLRIRGWMGHTVDTVAVLATLFGIATSLGLGTMQIASGLTFLGWVEASQQLELGVIVGVTILATLSVASGLKVGIRRLSELNMILAALLLGFVFLFGPTLSILNGLIQNTGAYFSQFLRLSTWTDTYLHSGWLEGWTAFYWAWWIAWAPFVGAFIARISRGRTIREYVLGVLFVPVGMTFLWLTVFGNSALELELSGSGSIADAVEKDVSTALFAFFQHLPLPYFTSGVAVIVLILFFVTSADSGALVIDSITAGGDPNPPLFQRIYWAVLVGVVAAILLVTGGLSALQTGSIVTGLPFSLVLLMMAFGLFRVLNRDRDLLAVRQYEKRISKRGSGGSGRAEIQTPTSSCK